MIPYIYFYEIDYLLSVTILTVENAHRVHLQTIQIPIRQMESMAPEASSSFLFPSLYVSTNLPYNYFNHSK